MTTLLMLSFKGAVVVGLVALVLALVERAGGQIPAFLRHALWLLVFVRLVTPVLPASPASLLFFVAPLEETGYRLLPGLGPNLPVSEADSQGASGAGTGELPDLETVLLFTVLAVWLVGLLILLGRASLHELRLRRWLADATAVQDPRSLEILAEARRRVNPPMHVPLLESPKVAAPAILGALRPRILLPPNALTTLGHDALLHALLHELAHVRRWDGATRLFARLAVAVHWFNPAAWFALTRFEAACELACDAAVLERLEDNQRTSYGRTLLHAATLADPRSANPRGAVGEHGAQMRALTSLPLSTHHTLKRRIQMIAQYHSPSRLRSAGFSLAAATIAFVALTDVPSSASSTSAPAAAPSGGAGATALGTDSENAVETLNAMRTAGTAMYSWITESGATELGASAESGAPQAFSWSACPSISHTELAELLVPDHLAEGALPSTDGWGNDLEFCLDRSASGGSTPRIGIRSPGKHGRFEGSSYSAGSFSPSNFDHDLVWMDGFFVAWPSPEAAQ